MHLECNPVARPSRVHVSPRQPSPRSRPLTMMHCRITSITHRSFMCTLVPLPQGSLSNKLSAAAHLSDNRASNVAFVDKENRRRLWFRRRFSRQPFQFFWWFIGSVSQKPIGAMPSSSALLGLPWLPFLRLLPDWPFRTYWEKILESKALSEMERCAFCSPKRKKAWKKRMEPNEAATVLQN